MRLVAWNANYNSRKRSLDEDIALLQPLSPDIMVLSETAPPTDSDSRNVTWIGQGAPGLAVVVQSDLELLPHAANAGAPPLMGCFSVLGRVSFQLLALWPVQSAGTSYHQILMAALDRYQDVVSSGRVIMAGDLNSSSRVTGQKTTHPQFVAAAGSQGIVSAYHTQTGEAHGSESIGTYRHGYNPDREFHIDYCFLSQPLATAARVTIVRDEPWSKRSDHFPLLLDLPDTLVSGGF